MDKNSAEIDHADLVAVLEAVESFLLQWRTEKHLPIHGRTHRKLLDLKDAVDHAHGKEKIPPREWRKHEGSD